MPEQTFVEASPPWFVASDRPTIEVLAPGTPIGEFAIECLLGMGAMGTVYGAIHPVIGRRVAIKVLRRELIDNAEAVARFVREAQAASRVRHKHVVDVFTFGALRDGRAWFAMEWLEGESLRARLGRPLLLGEVCRISEHVIDALEALHAESVVHRDLKPDNVFLTEAPGGAIAKVLDFGVAKLVDSGDARARLTKAGFVVGTAEYASPEQASGHSVDHRADIYSLGVMLFELLTGRRPFDAATPMDLLVEHIVQPPPWPSSVRPTLPRELDILVLAMLAKDPAARPSLSTVRANLVHLSGSLLPVGPIVRAGPEQRTFVEERILAVAPAQPARAASVRPFPAPPVTPAVTPPSSSAPSVIVAPSVQPLSPSPRPDPAPPPSPGAVPPPSAAASQSLARVMEAVPAPVSGVADRTDLIRPAMLMAEPFHREIRNGGGWRWWLAGALMVALGVALAFALR